MHKDFVRASEIRAQVFRKKLGLGSSGPIDPKQIARSLGITILTPQEIPGLCPSTVRVLLDTPATLWSACSFPWNGTLVIILNPNQTSERTKITTMEEIVHFMLRHRPTTISTALERTQIRDYYTHQEKEAYTIAAAMLMPRVDLLEAMRKHLTTEDIATTYGLSLELVQFRIQTLRLSHRFSRSQQFRHILALFGD
jgi:hypothetical protein